MSKDSLTVFIKGKGEVKLTPNDFISQGGEGSVYGRAGTAYKVYHDPKKMIPLAKIQELGVLEADPNIIRPIDVLLDKKNNPIGYTMRQLPATVPLPRLFTKAFKQRENITPEMAMELVRKMAQRLAFIHTHQILAVDYNEMNFAVLADFSDTVNFDVDSYQTKSFPATALMESVRDRHAKVIGKDKDGRSCWEFTTLTDWFSCGIVTFQLLIGIHPFKGKHPTIKYDDAAKTLDERMIRNISVMNADVGIPAVCYPFDIIPPAWKDWYFRMFEKGERMPPPLGAKIVVGVVAQVKLLGTGDKLKIMERTTVKGTILKVYTSSSVSVILTDAETYVDKQSLPFNQANRLIGFTPKYNHAIIAWLEGDTVKLYNASRREEIKFAGAASAMMESDNRLYLLTGGTIIELQFMETASQTLGAARIVAQVLPQAVQLYEGVVIQNLLGSFFANIFPASNTTYQIGLPELNDYKVIDAKYENHVLMVIGNKKGQYDRLIFRIGDDFKTYDCRTIEDVQLTGLNFTVLDNGNCAVVNEDDTLEIFRNKVGADQVNQIKDKAIDADVKLFHDGTTAIVAKGNKVYTVTVRK